VTDAIENACIRCGTHLGGGVDYHQIAAHATWDVASGAGPFCGDGCVEMARRGIPATWEPRNTEERLAGLTARMAALETRGRRP
jgi:hypothetical protein